MKSTLVFLVLFAVPFLSHSAQALHGAPSSICRSLGGTPETGRSPVDIEPLCTIGGGTLEYWTLFKVVKEGQTTRATDAFLKHRSVRAVAALPVDDQPDAYCRALGGTPTLWKDEADIEFGMCEFADQSAISAHTLLVGPRTYHQLTCILRGACH